MSRARADVARDRGRPRVGSVFPHGDHLDLQITLPDGSRSKRACLAPDVTEKQARAEAVRLTKLAAANGGTLIAARPATPRDEAREMDRWFASWLADRKAKGFTSTNENSSHYENHIALVISSHVRSWTRGDLRALSRALDAKIAKGTLSWKTARNIWTTTGKMLADAVKSKHDELRCREDNPIRDVEAPNRGHDRARCYLYPSEFLRFISCPDVPLHWRIAVAVAVYVGARAGELRVLRWGDLDLEHGTIHIHRARDRVTGDDKSTKSGNARRFALEANILPLLRTMHDERTSDVVLQLDSLRNAGRGLQRWLRRAGIERAELFTSDATRQPIRFHDLRATAITWWCVRGDEPTKIMARAGHSDFATTMLYVREAEVLRDGFGDVFPALPALRKTPLLNIAPNIAPNAKSKKFWRGGRDSNPRPPA